MRDYEEPNQRLEAIRQAKAIEEYWHSLGYRNVKAKAVSKTRKPGASLWGVKTNLINGLPEGWR